MDTRDEQRAAQLFKAALDYAGPSERAAFLDEACAGTPELRAAVQALLRADAEPGGFVSSESCPSDAEAPSAPAAKFVTAPTQPLSERSGTFVGHYKLLEQIGEGGFGVVWMAEQHEPVRRRVALKIIKLGMDTRQVVARFEAERQALALMDHDNIARVFDAGATDAGRPYFVMESVKGVPITQYSNENRLTIDERLDLFTQVCHAVQHAHQKAVIHRDLKPNNILVATVDDMPLAKVIDFGIAKATDHRLTEKTLFTEFHQMIGTPQYMSPEQTVGSLDIDTRTDVYSLGVLLYELLTGTPPFDSVTLREAAYEEIRRIIREDDPPKPSTRLSQLADTLPDLAAQRRVEPRRFRQLVHGELDLIVMKCLEKDRARRYETANALAIDIQRHLVGEPIEAKRDSGWYVLRKTLRRYRTAVTVAAAFVLVVMASAFALSVMYGRQLDLRQKAEKAARAEQERAEALRQTLYSYSIARVEDAYDDNHIALMKNLLQRCPPDLRALEWHILRGLSDRSQKTLLGHTDLVNAVVFAPDGRSVVSASRDRTIKVWDIDGGREMRTLIGHDDWVNALAVSPDGAMIASGSGRQTIPAPTRKDNTIRLWDSSTGNEVRKLDGHEGPISALDFSPDGSRIASASWDKTIRVWNVANGEEVLTIAGYEHAVSCLVFLPDGGRIVAGSLGRIPIVGAKQSDPSASLKIWDATNGRELSTIPVQDRPVASVAVSSDGGRIVWGASDGTVNVCDIGSAPDCRVVGTHDGAVHSVALNPDSAYVLSCGSDKTVKLWDAATGRAKERSALATLRGHDSYVSSAAFGPDGTTIVTGGFDKAVRLWDVDSILGFRGHTGWVTSLAFSPDGTKVVSGSGWKAPRSSCPDTDTTVRVWDLATGDEVLALRGHKSAVSGVAYAEDCTRILSISCDGELRTWDARSGDLIGSHSIGDGDVYRAAFNPTGTHFVAIGDEGRLEIGKTVATGRPLLLQEHGAPAATAVYNSDGSLVASGGLDRAVTVWNAADGERLLRLMGHEDYVTAIAFSPDGRWIASGSADKTIKIWDASAGTELAVLDGHQAPILALAFSPDGRRLVSGSWDTTIKVWDPISGVEILALRDHQRPVGCLGFAPDGALLVSAPYHAADKASEGKTALKVWRASFDD